MTFEKHVSSDFVLMIENHIKKELQICLSANLYIRLSGGLQKTCFLHLSVC